MRNNETGEFEMVVGNRQLLSGFFIVVLLFAVAFSMGYIVGRNSSPSAKLQAEAATGVAGGAQETRPQPASAAAPAASVPAAPAQPEPESNAQKPADSQPQPTTQPAQQSSTPAATPAASANNQPAAASDSSPGAYWQVIAVDQGSAEVVSRTLKEKGFPTTLAPGTNNLVRVLVGPYKDTQSLGRAKTDLENAGFNPILRK